MAMFHGFEIADMRSFEGNEGIGTQGTVYFDGIELGFWSNDGDGGMDRFGFPHEELDALIAGQVPEIAQTGYDGTVFPGDLSVLLAHLADLQDIENQWRELSSDGYAIVSLTDRYTGCGISYPVRYTGNIDDLDEIVSETASEMASDAGLGDCHKDVYWCEEQFVQGEPLSECEDVLAKIQNAPQGRWY